MPPIEKMDATLSTLKACQYAIPAQPAVAKASPSLSLPLVHHPRVPADDSRPSVLRSDCDVPAVCRHLSLSTNNIEKISSLSGMDCLTVLSLGRNLIKKIENLDGVADTLEELWISYNLIDKLTNIEKLTKLRVLYMHNNKVRLPRGNPTSLTTLPPHTHGRFPVPFLWW